MKRVSESYQTMIIISGLMLLSWILYWQTTGFDYVWDDVSVHLGDNPYLSPPSIENLAKIWTKFYKQLYIPMAYTGWGILKNINSLLPPGHNETFIFHFANVFIHMCNVIFVFLLLLKLNFSRLSSAFGAVLFLVHPIQVESVAWISEFRGLLAALFGFSALYINMVNRNTKKIGSPGIRFYILSALSCVLFSVAMLSKPSAISFLLIAIAIEHTIFTQSLKEIIFRFWPWCLVSGFVAALTALAQNIKAFYPMWVRPFLWMDAISFYMMKLIFPFPLVACYARTVDYLMGQWWFYLIWLVPVGIGYFTFKAGKSKLRHAALVIFIAGFLPVSGLKEFAFQEWSMVADRYLYLSMFGVSIAFALFLNRFKKPWIWIYSASVLCLLTGFSYSVQIPTWKNALALWDHCIQMNPRAAKGWNNRGNEHLDRRDYAKAFHDFDKALSLEPDYADALNNRGIVHAINKDYQKAIADYTVSIKLKSHRSDVFHYRGVAYANIGKTSKAISDFTKVLEIEPNHVEALYHRAGLYMEKELYDKSIADLAAAIELDPTYVKAYERRGIVYRKIQAVDLAMTDFEKAISLEPNSYEAYFNRGNIFASQQKYERAIIDYSKAVGILPEHNTAYHNRGLAYFYIGEYSKSLSDMKDAIRYGGKVDQNFIQLLKNKVGD